MVNLDHLMSISNYPNLFSGEDKDAIKELAEMYPDLFSSANDSIGLIKTDGGVSQYGLKVNIPAVTKENFFYI